MLALIAPTKTPRLKFSLHFMEASLNLLFLWSGSEGPFSSFTRRLGQESVAAEAVHPRGVGRASDRALREAGEGCRWIEWDPALCRNEPCAASNMPSHSRNASLPRAR